MAGGWHGRNAMVVRQWRILLLLRQASRTEEQIARELGCCPRTVRRDLDALSEVFPVTEDRDGGRGRRIWYLLNAMPEWPRREATPIRELRA